MTHKNLRISTATGYRRTKKHLKHTLVATTWNVHIYSRSEAAGGDQRIYRSRPQSTGQLRVTLDGFAHLVDRKLHLLAKALKLYDITVAAIQETK